MTMVFFSTCIAAIIAVLLRGHRNGGIYHVDTSPDALAFRYVPAAIGTVTVIGWRNVITTFSRITPYISMAAKRTVDGQVRIQ